MSSAAEHLKHVRTRSRLSQGELATRAGIAQSTVSRIEGGRLDPTWSTMSALLEGAGWSVDIERTDTADLIPASAAVEQMRIALRRGDEIAALRDLAEATSRIIQAKGRQIPGWAVTAPSSTGARGWDTIIATAFAYACTAGGGVPSPWMLDVAPLDSEVVLGSTDPTEEFREYVREQTPDVFRAKNILTRERDWVTA